MGGVNLYQYAPNPVGWVDPLGLAHKNSKDYKGKFILYEITDKDTGEILKVGKADSERTMASGKNMRAHTSERLAKKTYPNAEITKITDLGTMTTAEAEAAEAKRVRELRKEGKSLPLNKEKRKEYQVDYDPDCDL